jgi:2-polyprenyl-3-methyl-5-hydroxy-6-metoxy-1,4-benzoquinol methylase
MYQDKKIEYFAHARKDIEPLIQKFNNKSVLELGCGDGSTLNWLKSIGVCNYSAGIDAFAIQNKEYKLDQFINFDLNKEIPSEILLREKFDIILCLDVLEHLIEPWNLLNKVKSLLNPEGYLIVSLPNIRNYRIVFKLLLNGRFDYEKDGIMDVTHLRFFTLKNSIELMEKSGYQVISYFSPDIDRWNKKILSKIGLSGLLAKQYLFKCGPTED